MGKPTPPPLPPAGQQGNNPENEKLPVSTPKPTLENIPGRPAPQKPELNPSSPQDNAVDIDFDVIKPRKKNYLWIIPTVICLLLIGAGIYAWYYVKEKEEKERREKREEKEEQEAREKAIADSIAEAQRLQEEEENARLNFSTPDLTFLSLKGHVQSIHYKTENLDNWPDITSMLFNDLTINYDYDGNFVNLPANLNRGTDNPSVSYGAGNMVTDIIYYTYESSDSYRLRWNGDYLNSMTDETEYITFSENHSGGIMSSPETITWKMNNRDGGHAEITFKLSYSDRDEYGNWRTAYVTATGSNTYITEDYNEYYEEWDRRSVTENLNYNYTIRRFINYYDKTSAPE